MLNVPEMAAIPRLPVLQSQRFAVSCFGWHGLRKRVDPSAGQVQLDGINSVSCDGLKELLDRRAAKGLRENSELTIRELL